MDIIFGSITADERHAHIERGESYVVVAGHIVYSYTGSAAAEHRMLDQGSMNKA